jgi:cell surface protein SprA
LEGITIDSQNGRIMFPVLEPFGSDLAKQFTSGETILRRDTCTSRCMILPKPSRSNFSPSLTGISLKGTYTSTQGSEYQLNAVNIPQGSVVVTAGNLKLNEGADYTVDYSSGRIRILEPGPAFVGPAYQYQNRK